MTAARLERAGSASTRLVLSFIAGKRCRFSEKNDAESKHLAKSASGCQRNLG